MVETLLHSSKAQFSSNFAVLTPRTVNFWSACSRNEATITVVFSIPVVVRQGAAVNVNKLNFSPEVNLKDFL